MKTVPDSDSPSSPSSPRPDVRVEDYFSLFLVRPLSGRAQAWLELHVQAGALWFGGALVVEPRFVQDIMEGIKKGGLNLIREWRGGRA